MVKVNLLRAKIVELGLTIDGVARQMGVNQSTLYRRFQSPETLTVKEVGQLTGILHLGHDEAQKIFFA